MTNKVPTEGRRRHETAGARRGSSSQYKGVSWKKRNEKWQAAISAHGRVRHLGLFDDEAEAARAYDAAALDLYGIGVYLNFPDGAPRPSEETHLRCKRCNRTKPITAFSPSKAMRRGVRNTCKLCISAKTMEWADANRDAVLNAHLRRSFGISLEQYNDILERQAGVCAICGDPPPGLGTDRRAQGVVSRLAVDHCHVTGRVRGLLCSPCNKGLGHLRDDPLIVKAALYYLEERS